METAYLFSKEQNKLTQEPCVQRKEIVVSLFIEVPKFYYSNLNKNNIADPKNYCVVSTIRDN